MCVHTGISSTSVLKHPSLCALLSVRSTWAQGLPAGDQACDGKVTDQKGESLTRALPAYLWAPHS